MCKSKKCGSCVAKSRTRVIPFPVILPPATFDRSILITQDGDYIVPLDATDVHITLWGGGGGGGGGSHKVVGSDLMSGGGGGAGGYIVYRYPMGSQTSFTAIIGAGGIGGDGELVDDGESGEDGLSTVAIFTSTAQLVALGGAGGKRSCVSSTGTVLEKGWGGTNEPLILPVSLRRYSVTGADGGTGDGFDIAGTPGSPMFFSLGGTTPLPLGGGGGAAGPSENGVPGGNTITTNGTSALPNSGGGGGGGAPNTNDASPNRGGTGGNGGSGGILLEYNLIV